MSEIIGADLVFSESDIDDLMKGQHLKTPEDGMIYTLKLRHLVKQLRTENTGLRNAEQEYIKTLQGCQAKHEELEQQLALQDSRVLSLLFALQSAHVEVRSLAAAEGMSYHPTVQPDRIARELVVEGKMEEKALGFFPNPWEQPEQKP